MTVTLSNLHRVEVLASSGLTELTRKAAGLSPYSWSAPLVCPSLGTLETRLNPAFPPNGQSNYPDRAANENNGNAQCWIWSNKLLWDPITHRAYGVGGPANATDNFWSTMLWCYDRASGVYQSYESPLAPAPSGGLNPTNADWPGTAAHLFDNNCISLTRRRLYKWTVPKAPTGPSSTVTSINTTTDVITHTGYAGNDLVRFVLGALGGVALRSAVYMQPQVIGLNLDAITMTKSSAQLGAARVELIDRPPTNGEDVTAPALEFMPNMGSAGALVMFHKNRYWTYDFNAKTWSNENVISSMTVTNAFHNVGHRHPVTDRFVFGGGSYDGATPPGTRTSNRQFFTLTNAGVLTELDPPPNDPTSGLPIVVSVNNGADELLTRGCFAPDAGSNESLVFHDNGFIYAVDTLTGAWRTVGSKPYFVDWVCAVPAGVDGSGQAYGVIMTGHSDVALPGQSSIRLYRAA